MTKWLTRYWLRAFFCASLCAVWFGFVLVEVLARNINQYSDTISTSAPDVLANHTLAFRLDTALGPGAVFELTPPAGFEIIASTSFSERNVEMFVDSNPRSATTTASPGYDQVEIVPGSPGLIRYTLEPTVGIAAGSNIVWKIGDHTSLSSVFSESFSTTTGTSTTPEDTPGIRNALATGTHVVDLKIFDGGEVANAGFSIALVEQVGVGPVDTTEIIPPLRFNGAPTSTVGGTTLSVEISLETDELAICKFSASSSVAYDSMTSTFTNTGLIFHSTIVAVTPNTTQTFYVRCMDDEGNKNIDDYLIQFAVSDIPTGNANTEGDVSGDGSGEGNDGTGDGGGSGGTTGQSDGEAPETGGASGAGGSGGGGGGGRGGTTGSGAGGGFESTDGPYRSGDGQVEITGFAHPRARVTVLVDGQIAETVTAGSNGAFSATVEAIARGAYTFGLYATDINNIRSTTFSTSFTVTGARTTALSNINIASTIRVTPDPVTPGSPATLTGYTLPNAAVTLEVERDKNTASRRTLNATSTSDGLWTVSLPTEGYQSGTYKVRARAVAGPTLVTPFSGYTLFGVGQAAERPSTADLNSDGKVNLTDFSILLFWWNTAGGSSNPPADINRDGRVTLTDFSIMLFNWTG